MLVHSGGRGEHSAADVGNARHFEESLDRPVLAEGAVKQRERHVEASERLDDRRAALRFDDGQGARRSPDLHEHAAGGSADLSLRAGRLQRIGVRGSGNPRAVAPYPDGDDVVLVRVHSA